MYRQYLTKNKNVVINEKQTIKQQTFKIYEISFSSIGKKHEGGTEKQNRANID